MSLPETRYSLLVRLADADDAEAWSEFCATYASAVYRYARSRGLDDADAEEVVQDVWVTVHRKIGQWRPSQRGGGFRAWLRATAHRTTLRALRRRLRRDAAVGGTTAGERLHAVATADRSDAAERRRWRLWAFAWAAALVEREVQPATWEAFRLTAIEGTSPAEAASRLGLSIGSVYAAKCRVIARIRQAVTQAEGFEP